MCPLTVILLVTSFLIWLFVGFSIYKQYRYTTLIFDFLPFYFPLTILGFISYVAGILVWISLPLWFLILSIGIFVLILYAHLIRRWRKCYTLSLYASFLDELKNPQYLVHTFNDYQNTNNFSSDKVHVFIRHDVDLSLKRLSKIVELEKFKGLLSTSFFRLHSEKYSFEQALPLIKQLNADGFEIGFHYESLSQTKGNKDEAVVLFTEELKQLREIAPVSVVAHHGDKYDNHTLWPIVDKKSLEIWSAYDMKRDKYLTDTGGNDMVRQHGHHIFAKLDQVKPGDIVQVLIHADWWY